MGKGLGLSLGIMAMLAGVPDTAAQDQPYRLGNAVERSVASNESETYRVFVHVPDEPPPPEGFPLLYALDGADNFPIAVATAIRLARARQRSGVQPGIVVGIDSGDLARCSRDYTPRFDGPAAQEGQPGHGLPTGGADAFLDFIEQRLQPALARDFPVDQTRAAIVGHSFAGVLALNALITRQRLFAVHAVASPSVWLADGALVKSMKASMPSQGGMAGKRLLVTVVEKEDGTHALAFADAARAKGIDVTFQTLMGESHGSSMLPTISSAVMSAFSSEY